MRRFHLFEFEDQPWFPEILRNFGTDFLRFLANKTNMYQPVIPLIGEAFEQCKTEQIIDLASGGGGGMIRINQELMKHYPELKIILTDFYPNLDAFRHTQKQSDNFLYEDVSVDVRNVPKHLKGLRTQFLSFHHFKPQDARLILQNAVDTHNGIAIFEAQERSIPSLLAMFFSPITVLLTTPMIRPFRWSRILFTYLIPVVPLFVWWDGIVSALRTYAVDEMSELVDSLKNRDQFNWKIGRVKSGPGVILYLIGTPKL